MNFVVKITSGCFELIGLFMLICVLCQRGWKIILYKLFHEIHVTGLNLRKVHSVTVDNSSTIFLQEIVKILYECYVHPYFPLLKI